MKRHFLFAILLTVLCVGCSGITVELSGQPPVATPGIVVPDPPCCPSREVLFFTQSGCSPCEKARPQVEEMKKQGLKVTEVWYHENPELFRQYEVSTTPTFIVLEDGIEIERTGDIVLLLTILVKVLTWILPILLG